MCVNKQAAALGVWSFTPSWGDPGRLQTLPHRVTPPRAKELTFYAPTPVSHWLGAALGRESVR